MIVYLCVCRQYVWYAKEERREEHRCVVLVRMGTEGGNRWRRKGRRGRRGREGVGQRRARKVCLSRMEESRGGREGTRPEGYEEGAGGGARGGNGRRGGTTGVDRRAKRKIGGRGRRLYIYV